MANKPLIKVIRLEIVKSADESWDTLGPKLRELQRKTAEVLNWCMRQYYVKAASRVEELQKSGEKPSKKNVEIIGKSLCEEIGHKFGGYFPSYVYAEISNIARQRFQNDWFNILVKGDKRLPFYRNDGPIVVAYPKDAIHLREENVNGRLERYVDLKIFPKQNNRVPITRFLLNSRSFDDSRKTIWDRIRKNKYELCMAQLLYHKRKRKWLVNISYKFKPEAKAVNPAIRVGVDLGLTVPVCLALNDGYDRAFLREEGETIQGFRRQIDYRRKRLRRNERGVLERRAGHGRKHKIQSIERLGEKVVNFRRTANHRLSKAVVNFAVKNNAGVIVMEDLSGYTDAHYDNIFLKNWSYFELQTMIEQKAAEQNIKVEKVLPKYTSQRCSKCGDIDEGNREGREFRCLKCGFTEHSDYNAAKNIATLNIADVIASSLNNDKKEVQSGKPCELPLG